MRELIFMVTRIVFGVVQLTGVGYAALVAWLITSWMVDDAWAAQARDADWWALAGQRAAVGLCAAGLAGAVLLGTNHLLARWRLGFPGLKPVQVACIGAATVALATMTGAVNFIVERPFM